MKPENKLKVSFIGEPGFDGGGPRREFLTGTYCTYCFDYEYSCYKIKHELYCGKYCSCYCTSQHLVLGINSVQQGRILANFWPMHQPEIQLTIGAEGDAERWRHKTIRGYAGFLPRENFEI